jgi:predicted porin
MNKSLIALAVLAASSAAMAQSASSVTLYGRVDLSVGSIKELGKGSQSKMFQGGAGGLTTSRWGLRGTEDLGGGLKAVFKLEQRLNADTGEIQAPSFKAETSVGLSGGFGKVVAGRMTTVYDDIRGLGNSNNLWDSAFTPAANGVFGSGGDYSSRFNSQIRYDTPVMGGVYGGVSYAFEQTAGKGDKLAALMLGYKDGPVNVALAYQDEKTKAKYTTLAGSYNFGVAALSAAYNHRNGATDAAGDDNEFQIGVNVPVGAWNVSAGYANSKTKVSGATSAKADGFALGATYSLSKRTTLYAAYRTHKIKNAVGTKTADTQLYAMGVRHDF